MKNSLIASSTAGIVEVLSTHPLDIVKTEMQLNMKSSCGEIGRKIMNKYGVVGFYRGMTPRLAAVTPMRTIFWTTRHVANENLPITNPQLKAVTAGLLSGIAQTVADTPAEVMKIRIIDNSSLNHIDMFRGWKPNILRNAGFASTMSLGMLYAEDNYDNLVQYGGIVGSSAALGSILTHPLDVLKTQQQRGSKINTNINVFKGVMPRTVTALFTMGIGSVVFKNMIDWLE